MIPTSDIDEIMNRFRLASRETFNHYFKIPTSNNNDGWLWEERFSVVEDMLFRKLVVEPASLNDVAYGQLQPEIGVELISGSGFAPIMINRGVDTGYWDHAITEVTKEARLVFIQFFDWDQLAYRDNRYVRVKIDKWEQHTDVVGYHALIESQYVRFVRI